MIVVQTGIGENGDESVHRTTPCSSMCEKHTRCIAGFMQDVYVENFLRSSEYMLMCLFEAARRSYRRVNHETASKLLRVTRKTVMR